jgi:hypothetical protein
VTDACCQNAWLSTFLLAVVLAAALKQPLILLCVLLACVSHLPTDDMCVLCVSVRSAMIPCLAGCVTDTPDAVLFIFNALGIEMGEDVGDADIGMCMCHYHS